MFTNEQLHDILHLQLKLNGRTNPDNCKIAISLAKVTHDIWKANQLPAPPATITI